MDSLVYSQFFFFSDVFFFLICFLGFLLIARLCHSSPYVALAGQIYVLLCFNHQINDTMIIRHKNAETFALLHVVLSLGKEATVPLKVKAPLKVKVGAPSAQQRTSLALPAEAQVNFCILQIQGGHVASAGHELKKTGERSGLAVSRRLAGNPFSDVTIILLGKL